MKTIIKILKTKTILLFCFIACLIALTANCFGQEKTIDCNKINTDGRVFIYHNDFLKEKQMHKMLIALNDNDINRNIRKAKINKIQQIVSMSLGLCLLGAGSVVFAGDNLFQTNNTVISDNANALVLGGCMFMVVCDINYSSKHKYNKRAVKLYNQKYNY